MGSKGAKVVIGMPRQQDVLSVFGRSALPRRSAALLLFVYAQSGRRALRDRLVELLWADRFREQGRQSLRQELVKLRKELAGSTIEILTERDSVAVTSQSSWPVYDRLLDQQTPSQPTLGNTLTGFWRGEFGEGLDGISAGYDAWLCDTRTASHMERIRLTKATAVFELARGHREDAMTAARFLLSDPTERIWAAEFVEGINARPGVHPPAGWSSARVRMATAGVFLAAALGWGWTQWPKPTPESAIVQQPILRPFGLPHRIAVVASHRASASQDDVRRTEGLLRDLEVDLALMPGAGLASSREQADFLFRLSGGMAENGEFQTHLQLSERSTGASIWSAVAPVPDMARPKDGPDPWSAVQAARAYAALLAEADRRRPVRAPLPEDAAEQLRQGWAVLRGGANPERTTQSFDIFKAAVATHPDVPELLTGLAHAYALRLVNQMTERRDEEAAEALRLVDRSIALAGNQAFPHFVRGLVHKAERRYEAGIAAFRLSIQLSPNQPAAYAQMAHLQLLTGAPRRAALSADTALRLAPDAGSVDRTLLYAGMAKVLLGEYGEAARFLEQARARNPAFADVHVWLAIALWRGGQVEPALSVKRDLRQRGMRVRLDHHILQAQEPAVMTTAQQALDALNAVLAD